MIYFYIRYSWDFNMQKQDIQFQIDYDACRIYAVCDGKKIGNIFFVKIGNDKIMISETEIEPEYQNKNLELYLVQEIIKIAREQNRKIVSICPYISQIFIQHPEFDDVRLLNNTR